MAIIKCLECGNDVSDKAQYCPNCGCPINAVSKMQESKTVSVSKPAAGTNVQIRLSQVQILGLSGKQEASILLNGTTIWKGNTGEVAEIEIAGPTQIEIKYHMSLSHYGGKCIGMIDPARSVRYCVKASKGVCKTKLTLFEGFSC